MPKDDRTETVTPSSTRAALPEVIGVVAVFTEGKGPLSRPLAVRQPVCVGRDESADLVLDDPKASRRHAELRPAPGGVVVRDLGSRNGSVVDGQRIDGEQLCAIGATVRVGHTLLRVVGDVASFGHEVPLGGALVGGPSLGALRQLVQQAARSDMPVLIEGESGVGKELVAGAIHAASGRSGALVAVNCAAIPGELIEAELFGHVRGAFSGAEGTRRGLVRSAEGGTLFLDEIGEMPLETQAKLLRVLESHEVRPVGEDRLVKVDVRFVAATNVPLDDRVEEGRFREDLFHRIAALRVAVPPLRERREDVPLLSHHFLAAEGTRCAPTVEAMEKLIAWRWPGNVRELKNAVRFAANAAGPGAERFDVAQLPDKVRAGAAQSPRDELRARLEEALSAAGGNVSEAARQLGMRRATVYEQAHRLGIDPGRFRGA